MKLHQNQSEALNTVTAYDSGFIEVNAVRHEGGIYFMPEGPVMQWPATTLADLNADIIAQLLSTQAEIVLLGTGEKQYFPKPDQIEPLIRAGRGYEVMSTSAACRTYNILMAEGRLVMAALLPI
ncbi:MAG: Mth938-like domain-containing protein [Burkholderiaceae bacterium]